MSRPQTNQHSAEAIRFFLVSLTGLAVDIGIAWALIAFWGVHDLIAAVAGFSIATVSNYFGHQFWTFHRGERRASMRRFTAFCGVVAVSLIVRLLVLDRLGPLLPGSGLNAPVRLGLAAGASFVVSFLMSKFLIFDRRGDRIDP